MGLDNPGRPGILMRFCWMAQKMPPPMRPNRLTTPAMMPTVLSVGLELAFWLWLVVSAVWVISGWSASALAGSAASDSAAVAASVVVSVLLVVVASTGAGVVSASAETVESATWAAGPAGAASWALATVPDRPKLIAIVKVTSVLRTPRD